MCLSNLTAQESAMRMFRVTNRLPAGLRKKEGEKEKAIVAGSFAHTPQLQLPTPSAVVTSDELLA